jgi:regulator of replication initiation timing
MDIIQIIGFAAAPITGVISWLAAARKRRHDFFDKMQSTINMLLDENIKLTKQVVAMNQEIIELRTENKRLCAEIECLIKKLDKNAK